MSIASDFPKCQTRPNQKPEADMRRYVRHLVKSIGLHNTVADLLRIKFGKPVQNHIPMTAKRSKSKLGVEFIYGGRLFSTTGSSRGPNISAVD